MLNNLKNKKKKKGFTLIELIIVIAIIAILAAVALPRLSGFTTSAKKNADIASAKTIANAVSILMAEDKLKTDLTTATDIESAEELVSYLQSVPTPQNGGEKFLIKVTNNEIVVTDDTGVTYFPEYKAAS
jgi:type IV pilus assembly protein PilA